MATIPTIELHRTPSPYPDVHDPATYARNVENYAKVTHEQSLYPGHGFEALVQFLRESHEIFGISNTQSSRNSDRSNLIHTNTSALPQPHQAFATHYALRPGQRAEAMQLQFPRELESIARSCSLEKMGQLIILRGYPSPAWLCSIGASYDVDPEFFRRHLDFLSSSDGYSHQDGASKMPSSSSNIFQFRFPTVGSYIGPVRQRGAQSLTELREAAQASMTAYSHKLRIGLGWRSGDSVVREYNVHDMDRFSVEQAVTVYFSRLRPSPDHWVLIMFLDSGADPSLCEWPDTASSTRHLPLPHQRRSIALKPDLWNDEIKQRTDSASPTAQWQAPSPRAQSVSRLHLRYGRFLRPEIMHQDPFYVLSELFSILSYAEAQVLDVIEVGLARDSWQAAQEGGLGEHIQRQQAAQAQNNLVHARQMLEVRIANLSDVVEFVEQHQRHASAWPHTSEARLQKESDATAKSLQLDFQYLHRRAKTLSSRCESAMTLAMNRASIAEAQRSIHQSHTLSRFTALAFVFVPATATAGFFGMNFEELGTGHLSIWYFFAVSIPLFCVSFMFLYDGWRKVWDLLRRTCGISTENAKRNDRV